MMTWIRGLLGLTERPPERLARHRTEDEYLDAARRTIIEFHGKPGIDLDRFASEIVRLVQSSCDEAVLFDRQETGRQTRAAKQRMLELRLEADAKALADQRATEVRVAEESRVTAARVAEEQRLIRTKAVAERREARKKSATDLRSGATLHATDQCRCRGERSCRRFVKSLLEQAERLEEA